MANTEGQKLKDGKRADNDDKRLARRRLNNPAKLNKETQEEKQYQLANVEYLIITWSI